MTPAKECLIEESAACWRVGVHRPVLLADVSLYSDGETAKLSHQPSKEAGEGRSDEEVMGCEEEQQTSISRCFLPVYEVCCCHPS